MAHRPDTPPTLTWQHMEELQNIPFDADSDPTDTEPVIVYSPTGGVEVLPCLFDDLVDDPDCLPLWWRTEADDMLLAARKALPKGSKCTDKTLRQRIVKTMNVALAEPFTYGLMSEGTVTRTPPKMVAPWPKTTVRPTPSLPRVPSPRIQTSHLSSVPAPPVRHPASQSLPQPHPEPVNPDALDPTLMEEMSA